MAPCMQSAAVLGVDSFNVFEGSGSEAILLVMTNVQDNTLL